MAEIGGGRQRFTVELRTGETTIVSWKKLIKDATSTTTTPKLPSNDQNTLQPPPPPPPLPSVDPSSVEVSDDKAKEGPPTSRLSTVIEKIERLYVGKASSDEEDLNDVVPDEDEYDTEDSFIDDADLDDYFQVDNSAIKHDGFFVNRGKLERVEPSKSPSQQQKKRRRKDLGKDGDSVVSKNPNKRLKEGKKNEKIAELDGKNASIPSHIIALPSPDSQDVKLQNEVAAPEINLKKKTKEAKSTVVATRSDETNGDGIMKKKKMRKQKQTVVPSSMNSIGEMSINKNSHGKGNSSPGKSSNNVEEHGQTTPQMSGSHERPAITNQNIIDKPVQLARVQQRKEGSSARPPRSTMLEKSFRDLEKLVAECRPPVSDVQDGENSSQYVKRRLPPEVKQKIARVARLAQASHGKISKEVLNRLMSIVGHMIQLRSLKRNLKIMVNMGLSAKQEKDHRVQLKKREVADMVHSRIPLMKSKAQELLDGMSDDLKESNTEEIEALKRKYSMDDSLEDKIRDLYDLYVEGLEADAGPQVRKLYAELAAFWPSGFMDNHGIKRAICRAKDRRRPLQSRQQNLEKVKKALVTKAGVKAKAEASSPAQSLHTGPSSHSSSFDRPKQEKMKGTLSNSGDIDGGAELVPTKKATITPEIERSETECPSEDPEYPLKEGAVERQHLTASMLRQLFET